MYRKEKNAFGWPGIDARWTSSAKTGVGTSLSPASKIWYSISHGILNEIYYPQVDQACTRDMGIIVTDGKDFFSEEKRHTSHQIKHIADGVPAYFINNSCDYHNYRIEKEIISDPLRDTLLQRVQFFPTDKKRNDFKLFILLAPHLGNHGSGNTAWVGHYKGLPMLFAQRGDIALALACSVPWKKGSAGFVGYSDGWQDLMKHKEMAWQFERAENGNVALTGEVDLDEIKGQSFVLALGFGRNPEEAGQSARASIFEGFDAAKKHFILEWQRWQNKLFSFDDNTRKRFVPKYFSSSAAMLRVHESKRHPGGIIASLSIPWGFSKGDDNIGGYHLVWPRDMVQTAGGLLAARAFSDARRVLNYLMVTQEEDGHWPQNMWLDGSAYWSGIQMDQTALPIMLVDLVNKEINLEENTLRHFWPMIRKAAGFLVRNGPVTEQDRWEENEGYSTFTLSVQIAALLIAADHADHNNEPQLAIFLRETADAWNSNIERWTYITNSDLARYVGVEGYYVRIRNQNAVDSNSSGSDLVSISNAVPGEDTCPANEMVSPDALSLVRFGLRDAHDERILNTIKVLDATLKMDGPYGPLWYRYNRDGYGEHKDGSPFDGTGFGRPWPLLTGERAHYEIAAGNYSYAKKLLVAMENYANETGMFPEQIWDAEDLPDLELFFGRASGAAMPLAWAHAEYIKLCRSLNSRKIFDMPEQTKRRYLEDKVESKIFIWDQETAGIKIPENKSLRLQLKTHARVMWSVDQMKTTYESFTFDSGLGIYYADFPTEKMHYGEVISLSIFENDLEYPKNYLLSIAGKPGSENGQDKQKKIDRNKTKVFFPS